MTDLRSLLLRGYFPIELPPPFSTESFANAVMANLSSFTNEFDASLKETAKNIVHDIPRYGLYRRILGIPHPKSFYNLAKTIVVNWSSLISLSSNTPYSYSVPIVDTKIRSITTKYAIGSFPLEVLRIRANAKFILKTDIARCYESMYTHSIPWAIHTKEKAKKTRGDSLYGNQIDKWIRYSHDGQTLGIPIGPDTSLLVAETILAAVDREIEQKLPNVKGYRYIDDYEFGFKSYDEANEALTIIKAALKHYELAVNDRKTSILALPTPIEEPWVSPLRAFTFSPDFKKQTAALIQYFDKTFELLEKHPHQHILPYAIQRLRGVSIAQVNWDLVQQYLFQCMMVETGTMRSSLFMLKEREGRGFVIDKDTLGDVLNHQICQQAKNGYVSEVAWAVWGLIYWNINMTKDAADIISTVTDSFTALLALDAETRGLVPGTLSKSTWIEFMSLEGFYGNQWLLSYEAYRQKWLPQKNSTDNPLADPCFNFLFNQGVQFYDKSKIGNLIEYDRPRY